MAGSDWSSLTVVKLKEECKKRGLPVGGKKAELVERLEQHEGGEPSAEADTPAEEEQVEQEAEEAEEAEEAAAAGEAAEEERPAEEAAPASEERAAPEPASAAAATAAEDRGEEPAAQPMEAEEAAPVATEGAPELPQQAEAEPAAMEADQGAVAAEPEPAEGEAEQKEEGQKAQPAQQTPAGADVDLDYGEESDGEGAAAAEEPRGHAEEGAKRKRGEEPSAGKRGAGAGVAAAAARAAAGPSPDAAASRPAKVPRSGSGFSLGGVEKGVAPAPEDVPDAAEPVTRALRIDGFVRPFHERQVRELLSETGEVKALWMPSIKTHCYVVFETKAQAEATRRATYQLQWPATNPKRLAPRFVPLAEAETSIGHGAGNPDFRVKRTEEDGEEAAAEPEAEAPAKAASEPREAAKVPDRSQREWNRNRRSPTPPPLEGVRDLREMLSRRQSGGAATAAAAAAADVSRGRELPPGLGTLPPERREREGERRGSAGAPPPHQEERVLTLDELFKKTSCKPCIYWLPLTDEQVAEKKRKAADAAAAATEGGKPAENGTATEAN